MNKLLLGLMITFSSCCFAFPEYKSISCTGFINRHFLNITHNKISGSLTIKIDGKGGLIYHNESENRLYTDPVTDEDGDELALELVSNHSDWNATFNFYINNQLAASSDLICIRTSFGIDTTSPSNAVTLLSQLKK